MTWNPDYAAEFRRRLKLLKELETNKRLLTIYKQHYKNNPIDYIQDWHITIDTRNAMSKTPVLMPLILWDQQKEIVERIAYALRQPKESNEKNLALPKSRGVGMTWIGCHISEWLWYFYSDIIVSWGSNKEESVDKKDDPSCIMEKLRSLIAHKHALLTPKGYDVRKHSKFKLIMNPENGSVIVGKSGDEIGRGARSFVFFNDEKAFYDNAEEREKSLSENTDHQIDISTPNGVGNIFYNTIKGEVTPTIWCGWRNDPRKSQLWADAKMKEYEAKGCLFLWYQEYEMSFTAGVDNVVIKAEWVEACVDAHIAIGFEAEGETISGLDVADEGGDLNAQAIRKGVVCYYCDAWAEGDTGQTAIKALNKCENEDVETLYYDIVGVGSGVKSETNRLKRDGKLNIQVEIFNGGGAVVNPYDEFIDGIKNKDMFKNKKAQGWWNLRIRCEKTFKMRKGIQNYPVNELISFSSRITNMGKLIEELSQPRFERKETGHIIVDKSPKGTKSPNRADSVMICFAPQTTFIKPYST